jgi:hypothetical protein
MKIQGPGEAASQSRLRGDIERAVLAHAGFGDAAGGNDPDSLLELVDACNLALEECGLLQQNAVHQARRAGVSWAAIGEQLGITRQAAQQRFAPDVEAEAGSEAAAAGSVRRIYGATAFNEMQMLAAEGKAGFHLVGFGALYLAVKASRHEWEHRRETALTDAKRTRLEAAGWTFVGGWFPFQYFKRIKA